MRKPSYTVKFDKFSAEGVFITELTAPGIATLEGARRAYREMRDTLAQMGYRTAHDRIIGPAGEVYETEARP